LASPVVLLKKKNGDLRFCIDFRRLNAVRQKDVLPMPKIDDLLDQLSGKAVFSTLDAKSRNWQIQMSPRFLGMGSYYHRFIPNFAKID